MPLQAANSSTHPSGNYSGKKMAQTGDERQLPTSYGIPKVGLAELLGWEAQRKQYGPEAHLGNGVPRFYVAYDIVLAHTPALQRQPPPAPSEASFF